LSEDGLRQRVAIYGGTFDPIHNGHWQVAKAVLKAFAMDRLIFVPAFVPPHKRDQQISSAFHRLAMLVIATADEARMFVSTIELEAPERPYTIETLGRLRDEFDDAQLFFVMGADSFRDITIWREHERLLTEYDVIVATRPGYQDDENVAAHLAPHVQAKCVDLRGRQVPSAEALTMQHIYLTDFVSVDASSTNVREAVEQGEAVEDLVPPTVARYIKKYRLYRKS
jgi:nicotinate-nucleotide adenylyltransferase